MSRKINLIALKKEVSARLNLALERSNLKNQSAMADDMGVAKSDVHGYLSGKSLPKSEKLVLLSKSLEVSIDWILKGEESDKIRFKKVVEYIEQNIITTNGNNNNGDDCTENEKKLIELFRKFQDQKKQTIIQEIVQLLLNNESELDSIKDAIAVGFSGNDSNYKRWIAKIDIKNLISLNSLISQRMKELTDDASGD